MDWHNVCVIDKKDNRDITEDIQEIRKDVDSSRYHIIFNRSQTEFHYSFSRIAYLDKPTHIDIRNMLVFSKGKLQPEIKEMIRFDEWCRILYFDDVLSTVPYEDLQFVKDKRSEKHISEVMDYLMDVAETEEEKQPGDNDEEPGFLTSQLRSIPVMGDSVLSSFLEQDSPIIHSDSRPVIAPFSSNSSQLKAIHNALSYNLSIIQGPPGTGKTQTILNIIANLISRGKTIAVVSGNNRNSRSRCIYSTT